jgi:16S rRNA (cytosine967-C5)-methyltransferase
LIGITAGKAFENKSPCLFRLAARNRGGLKAHGGSVIAPARQAAYEALCRIELRPAHSDDVLNSELISRLEVRDRNLATEIAYGTLRWRAWLDYLLESAVSRSWDRVEARLRILLRLSLYQMSRMDRVPDHAIINDAVEITKANWRPSLAGFVNGVLRTLSRSRPWTSPEFHRDCATWIRVSLPQWLWERWEARFGPDGACEYALSLNQPPQTAFRLYGRQGPPDACGPVSTKAHADADDRDPCPFSVSEWVPGAYLTQEGKPAQFSLKEHFQDEASQMIPHLLGPIEGARVWDACAAPGGKAAILRERCGSSGWLICSDLDPRRARRLLAFLEVTSGAPFDVLILDVRVPAPFRMLFDAVLVDAPCSGLGTLRRNPELKWRCRPERLRELAQRQLQLLASVAPVVREGGLLLYSTCSTEPEENESVVEEFLESHPEFHVRRPIFPAGIAGLLDQQGMFRSYPGVRLWDGFFAALMVRSS